MFYSEFQGSIKGMVYGLIVTEKMLVSQMCIINQININDLTGHFFVFCFVPRRSNSIEGRRRKNGLGSRKIVNTVLPWKLKLLCFVELLKFV